MRILFISYDLIAPYLAYLMKRDGHEVKLFIEEKDRKMNFEFIVDKTNNWKNELDWVGKNGLIIFDNVGYGKIQDLLRKKGYSVFGSSNLGDKLESHREYCQNLFEKYGMKATIMKDFENMDDAVVYIKDDPRAWVIKQNGSSPKNMNYVGLFNDGKDTISVLKNYLQNRHINKERITLQEKIEGVEIGVGRYFNGKEWVGPIEINLEHKKFFPGNIGPTTSEMGTLAWYDDNENNKLFQETLAKIKPHLQEINFKGDIEINCIVNETGAYPLEATSRLGSPIIHLHTEIHSSPWANFLHSIAQGLNYDLKWKKGFGIVLLLAVPPFPYSKISKENIFYGLNVYFDNLTKEEMTHVHFEGLAKRHDSEQYFISDNRGYVLYVTGMGKTAEEAREKVYNIAKKIVIPKVMYRNDIALKFIEEDQQKLVEWGYL
jgi:phosphoribosylamine---glycine ligase